MILKELTFRRDYTYDKPESQWPMLGRASFENEQGEITYNLTVEDAKAILEICSAALLRMAGKKAEAMKAAYQKAIVLEKAREIGRGLPNEFA